MEASSGKAVPFSSAGILSIAVVLALGLTPNSVLAQSENERRTISVSGEGIVRVEPDMVRVNFGVATVSDDPEEARRRNAEAARNAMNAVRELGIEERFIRLEMLRLQPNREFDPETRRYIERGYEALRQVVVEVHDLDLLPTLIAEIVQQGANRLNSVEYELENRDVARNDAISKAVLNAREKAELIASTLNLRLGDVLQVHEQSFDFPRPFVRMESLQAMAKDDAAPEPAAYAAGELEVRMTVTAVFEILSL